jgi:hypothetical protein
MHIGTSPFGQPVRKVEQIDRSAKRVFVLGVYASAVHAKWLDPKQPLLEHIMCSRQTARRRSAIATDSGAVATKPNCA